MTLPESIALRAMTIVETLVQTDYQYTEMIDPENGIYDCDCNAFVGFILSELAPRHYALVPCEADQPRPRAFEYYDFFASLAADLPDGWVRIDRLADARAGDIIAWRFPTLETDHDTGHVMIVAERAFVDDAGVYSVRVCDAAAEAHFNDTRADGTGPSPTGVGAGDIKFTVDAEGKPTTFLFAPPQTAAFQALPIAIGRATPF